MRKLSFLSLITASVALAGCQKAKMKGVEHAQPSYNTSYTPPPTPVPPPVPVTPPPPVTVVPPPPPLPRYPDVEPRDPAPVPVQPVTPTPPTPTVIDPPTTPTTTEVIVPPPPVTTTTTVPIPTPRPEPVVEQPVHIPTPTPRPLQIAKLTPPPAATDTCGENQPCKRIEAAPGQCVQKPLKVEKISKALDILFVVDTSASLRLGPKNSREGGELSQIAREMENFVQRLDRDTDYRIGVLLGHGPKSKYYGKLFSYGTHDTAVLDYKKMFAQEKAAGGSDSAVDARVKLRMWTMLEQKMLNIPDDKSDAQGEALMLNIYHAVKDTASRRKIQAQGLFRKNANLAIIAITDEQDVCYNYDGSGYKPVMKTYKNKKGKSYRAADVHETRFFKDVCTKAAGGKLLTDKDVATVLHSLEATTGGKVIMNGVVYKSNNIPRGVEDENEMGHGILDLIADMNSGVAADLANVDRSGNRVSFANQLTLLGEQTSFQMKFNTVFNCYSNNIHPQAIDPGTLELAILDQGGREIARYNAQCRPGAPCQQGDGALRSEILPGSGGRPYLRVSVADQESFVKLMNQRRLESGSYKISFMTKADVIPSTGKPAK